MDPATISAGVQVFSAVRGIFGSSRRRREARAKQKNLKFIRTTIRCFATSKSS